MSSLKIASNLVVAASEYTFGVASPGHLQVVYGSDELEVQWPGLGFVVGADWDVRGSQTHDGGSYSSTQYAVKDVDFHQGQTESEVWSILQQVQSDIFSYNVTYGIDYNIFQNSNSYAATILWVVGVDVSSYLGAITPTDVQSGFPGVYTNVLLGVSGNSTPISLDLLGTSGNDFLRSGIGDDTLSGGEGRDSIFGGGGSDLLSGGNSDDQIHGSIGADTIDGGAGNDIIWSDEPDQTRGADVIDAGSGDDVIYFDELDTIDGGDGWDVAIYSSNLNTSSVNLDATQHQLEVVVAGLGDDTLSSGGSTETHLAGLDGDDTFNVAGDGGAPTIIWGDAGADTINIAATDPSNTNAHGQTGIMVVNVTNLNAGNFQNFDLSMVNVGAGFDWSQIDVVLLNPESTDQIFIDGSEVAVSNETMDIEYFTDTNGPQVLTSYPYVQASPIGNDPNTGPWWSGAGSMAAFYDVGFLGGSVTRAYSPAAQIGYWAVETILEEDPNSGHLGEWYVNDVDLHDPGDPSDDEVFKNYSFDTDHGFSFAGDDFISPQHVYVEAETKTHFWIAISADPDGDGIDSSNWGPSAELHAGAFGVRQLSDLGTFTDAAQMGPWFIVGGYFGDQGLAAGGVGGSFTATIPNPPEDAGSGATELSPSGGQRVVHNYNVSSNIVVLNGAPINPNSPGSQVILTQNGLSTEIRENGVLLATLVGVSLSAWQAAAAAQSLGTASDDTLVGTGAANLLAAGAGNDTITAGAGDDTILYTSGNDVIVGNATKNTGLDTLDLSKYTASQVHFAVNASHDVLITTPDGTIELDYQVRNAVGNVNSNIERIVFADMTIDEAAIRTRALGDQSTAGNDSVQGSIVNDVFIDGAGNDTIIGGGGDDTIVFGSGNDLIDGHGTTNGGFDTLDLSKYSSSQVKYAVNSSHDVLITTPDGTIELDYQVRYAVGNVNSNIERIVFSDMTIDEAAIRTRALGDQSTAGNDSVQGSIVNDVFIDGAGNDTIIAGGGDDTIVFGSGNDLIDGHGTTNGGFDTLDLSKYSSSQVTFAINSSYDVLVTTPDGTVELDYQVRYAVGDTKSNIERILFSDASLDEAAIRVRAVADQATAGNDIVLGTGTADRVAGGAGNDTLTGGAGADTFVFAAGGGNDRITDFTDGIDHIEFAGRTFSDLTITQSGSNSLIGFGIGDSVLLLGIANSALTQSDFVFV